MNNNHYSIYLESVFQLANTLVIKFDYVIESINRYEQMYHPGSSDEFDPTTWKYYLNVSGEYHPSNQIMTVISLDTLEEIVFSKPNLEIHRATARAYQYGTRFYLELVSKYPDQETLIRGILYPIDIDKAINARNGEIIGYPAHLIETNEYSFVRRLQEWIDSYLFRWINQGFRIAHDLYDFTSLAVFYSNLPHAIISLRHEMCKTNEAHSFHVFQYLASNGRLDRYKDQLTLKQALWLYRNIAHIKKNLGQIDTFEFLTEHIMTQRNIPLSGYTGVHNVESMPDELYPTIQFKRQPINNVESVETIDPISTRQLLIKEDKIARLNEDVRVDEEQAIERVFEHSLSNKVMTKALESTLFDYSGSSPYNLPDILLNHWIFLSSVDVYRAFIQLDNPRTGEIFSISVKDAFVYGYYFFCKAFNLELIEVPIVPAIRVQRIPMVTAADIMKVADRSLIPESLAQEMISVQPFIDPVLSTDNFYTLCTEIYSAANYQKNLVALQEHYYRRGLAHGMISQIYSDNICVFDTPNQTYEQWFAERGIKPSDYDTIDAYEIWLNVLTKATGMDVQDANSLASIQSAMTNIMLRLSSYTIQVIDEINSSPIRVFENPPVRPGDWDGFFRDIRHIDHIAVRVLNHRGKNKHYFEFDIGSCGLREVIKVFYRQDICFEIVVKPQTPIIANRRLYRVKTNLIGAAVIDDLSPNDENIVPVPGISIYLGLDDEERQHVADMYDNCYLDYQKSQ